MPTGADGFSVVGRLPDMLTVFDAPRRKPNSRRHGERDGERGRVLDLDATGRSVAGSHGRRQVNRQPERKEWWLARQEQATREKTKRECAQD